MKGSSSGPAGSPRARVLVLLALALCAGGVLSTQRARGVTHVRTRAHTFLGGNSVACAPRVRLPGRHAQRAVAAPAQQSAAGRGVVPTSFRAPRDLGRATLGSTRASPPLIAHGVPLTRALVASLLEHDLSVDGEDLLSGPRLGAGGVIHAKLPLLDSAQEVTLSHFAHLFFNISSAREQLREGGREPASLHAVFEALGYEGDVRAEVAEIELQLLEVRSRAAYGKLFRHNLGLIHQELNKHKTCTALERADMWQEGSLGLLRAIQLFDPSRRVRFSTYACWHIRAHMLHALRDKSHMLRLPQPLQDDMKQIRKASAHLTMENDGRRPSAAQLAEILDWPDARVQRALEGFSRSTVLALVGQRSDDSSRASPWANQVPADSIRSETHGIGDAEHAIMKEQFRNSVRKVQEGREPEHAKMLALRYGLYDGREWSTKQIAERFQVTSQAVYKIIRKEVKYLQARHEDFTSFVQPDAAVATVREVRRRAKANVPERVRA